jgi:hypothetical protein
MHERAVVEKVRGDRRLTCNSCTVLPICFASCPIVSPVWFHPYPYPTAVSYPLTRPSKVATNLYLL